MLTKIEFINMVWGIANHDKEALLLNEATLAKGIEIRKSTEKKSAARIGMICNRIKKLMLEGLVPYETDVPQIINSGVLPITLECAEAKDLLVESNALLKGMSNPDEST